MSEIENIKTIILRKFVSDKSRDLFAKSELIGEQSASIFSDPWKLRFTTTGETPKIVIYFESFERVSKVLSGKSTI